MCEYIILEDFLWTSIFMMKAMVFGINCKEIIISIALFYQPKKNSQSVCGDSDTYTISKSTAEVHISIFLQAAGSTPTL